MVNETREDAWPLPASFLATTYTDQDLLITEGIVVVFVHCILTSTS